MKSHAPLICAALLATGCSHIAANRNAARDQLENHSQALTSAVVDTLQLQPDSRRDPFTGLALELAREDQRIEGLPPDPIPVPHLLAPATAPAERARLDARFREIHRLLERERRATSRLVELGTRFEQQLNERRSRWFKWIASSTVLIGGLAALCVFVPAAIPLLGHLLAWLVSRVPSLAGALGLVSVKAFDAVVRGIDKSGVTAPGDSRVRLANDATASPSFPAAQSLGLSPLELQLSREMDAAHKKLVRSRKAALKL